MLRSITAAILALALPAAALASGLVESLKGEVQSAGAPIFQGQRISPPATITTGAGAQVMLRFDDGMQIVLNENSLLRVVDYRHTSSGVTDRAVFELLRGAARVVTGSIARDNPRQFFFRTPHSQLMVEKPSDFTVALVNPAFIAVHSGTLVSSNAAGPATLTQGSTSIIANSSVAPANIAPSSMPPQASNAMQNLSVANVGAPAGGPATGGAPVAGTAFGVPYGAPIFLLGAAAAAAAIGSDDDPSNPTPSHH